MIVKVIIPIISSIISSIISYTDTLYELERNNGLPGSYTIECVKHDALGLVISGDTQIYADPQCETKLRKEINGTLCGFSAIIVESLPHLKANEQIEVYILKRRNGWGLP